MAKMTRIEVIH